MEPTYDNYSQVVPELVDMPSYEYWRSDVGEIDFDLVETVMDADWYAVDKGHGIVRLCIPKYYADDYHIPYDWECETFDAEVSWIPPSLKRFSPEDGFYHA